MTPRVLDKLIAPLKRRVMLMIGRATINLVNSALKVQGVQVTLLADELHDNVEQFQQYGFTSRAFAGAEGIVVALGGTRNRSVLIACEDRRYRLTGLAEGEVALYDDLGSKIVLKRGNIIEVTAAAKLRVASPLLEATAVVDAATSYKVGGTKVVGAQGAAIPDVVAGGTTDANARATIANILANLRTHGLCAP